MKRIVTWVLVADGDRAKLFEHDGPGKGLHAIENLSFEQEHLRAREIMADKPGRAGAGNAPGSRAAMEYRSDPVDVRERRFLEQIADVLDTKCREGAYERLLVAAAPAALGELRPALSEQVRKTIMAELPKDLTNVPTHAGGTLRRPDRGLTSYERARTRSAMRRASIPISRSCPPDATVKPQK